MENNSLLAQVKCIGMYQKLTLQPIGHFPLEGGESEWSDDINTQCIHTSDPDRIAPSR